jgi:hypothetical protein
MRQDEGIVELWMSLGGLRVDLPGESEKNISAKEPCHSLGIGNLTKLGIYSETFELREISHDIVEYMDSKT